MNPRIACLVVAASLTGVAGLAARQPAPAPPQGPSAADRLDALVVRLDARTRQDLKLTAEVRDLLAAEPALLATVPDLLRSGAMGSDTAATLIMDVGMVGTPKAQQVLARIFGDPGQSQLDRVRAVIAAGAVSSPTDGGLDALWGLAQQRFDPRGVELSNTALLALGIAGANLRATEPARYPALRATLLSSLRQTVDRAERCVLLKAVANLQDPGLGIDVEESLFDPSAPVRSSAAFALGLMRCESSRGMLVMMLQEEPVGVVRTACVASLRRLTADDASLEAARQAVAVDPHPEVRAELVKYLAEHLDAIPAARGTLQDLFLNDPTKRVRLLAGTALCQ